MKFTLMQLWRSINSINFTFYQKKHINSHCSRTQERVWRRQKMLSLSAQGLNSYVFGTDVSLLLKSTVTM